jgi:hypothetical protein
MKRTFLTIAYLLLTLFAGEAADDCVIPLMVVVPQQVDTLAPMAQTKLESKLRQVVTLNGMEGMDAFSPFCLVATLTEGNKEVISGTRPVVTLTSNLDLYVGNNFTGEKFSAAEVILNGAGVNEAKAYTALFGGISANNVVLQEFLKNTKAEIERYYETQTDNIIKQANTFAIRHEYEEALCLLASVPTCCSKYDAIEACMLDVFQKYIDFDCEIKVAKARAAWSAGQNEESAKLAGAYLSAIDPQSSCKEDALALINQIRERMGDEWEFYKELKRDSVEIEKAQIEAIRAIGIAYGNNQKSINVRENWITR